jgi:hypothetical protein
MVTTPVAPDGTISIYNYEGDTHVIVDLLGVFDDGTTPTLKGVLRAVSPTRILDTRTGLGSQGKLPIGPNATLRLMVPGIGGGGAAVLNVTGTEGTDATFLTLWPSDQQRPTASNLNLTKGATTPNMVVVPIAPDGTINIYNYSGKTHVIADIVGYYT